LDGLWPDKIFYLDIEPHLALARLQNKEKDALEGQGLEILTKRVREGYERNRTHKRIHLYGRNPSPRDYRETHFGGGEAAVKLFITILQEEDYRVLAEKN